MSKWTCSHCNAINPSGCFKCHNCPNTCVDETLNIEFRDQRISDFVKGNGNKITVGQYEVRELDDGSFCIEHDSGEGMGCKKDSLEACIGQFYADYF